MANVNATGFFMVNYDEENWKKLSAQLREDHQVTYCCFPGKKVLLASCSLKLKTLCLLQVFSPSDRAGLSHDVFTLSW